MDKQKVLEQLRDAIQDAEQFGLVRTEDGTPITGVLDGPDGFTLVE
jgi:hypothetical protein